MSFQGSHFSHVRYSGSLVGLGFPSGLYRRLDEAKVGLGFSLGSLQGLLDIQDLVS